MLGAAEAQKREDAAAPAPCGPRDGGSAGHAPFICPPPPHPLLQGQTCVSVIQTRKPETLRSFAKVCSWEKVRPGHTPAVLCRALWGA